MLWPLRRVPPPSLRVKLVLSYLGVALGAILLLVVVISLAVQNYFYTVQINQLRSRAEYFAQQVATIYSSANKNWNLVPSIRDPSPELFEVIDTAGNHHNLNPPDFVQLSPNDLPALNSALQQSLNGQEVTGSLQGSSTDSSVFSGLYI